MPDYFNQGRDLGFVEFIDGEGQAQNMKAYLGDSVIDIGRKYRRKPAKWHSSQTRHNG